LFSDSSQRRSNQKGTDAGDNTAMNMQLSMTLAVGFVLLFVNIIAFAIVSYHNEKDKYKIGVSFFTPNIRAGQLSLEIYIIEFASVL